MHTISKFFTVLIILMVLIPSTIAAPNENANPKAGLKIVDQSKGTMKEIKDDKVKGIKSSSTDIVVDEKGKNSIKLKDVNPSKNKNEHKKVKVSLTASELASIDDASKDGIFGVLEIADDGTVIGQRTATTAQLVVGDYFTFSEVEINGFSGYRKETFASVKSGDILNTVDVSGEYIRTISVDGTIPAYVPITQNNKSTYPVTPVAIYPLETNSQDVSGNGYHGTDTAISYTGNGANFTGSTSSIKFPKFMNVSDSHTVIFTLSNLSYAAHNTLMGSGNLSFNVLGTTGRLSLATKLVNNTIFYTVGPNSAPNNPASIGYIYNATTQKCNIYMNGKDVTVQNPVGQIPNASDFWYLGKHPQNSFYGLKTISDVSYYNSALPVNNYLEIASGGNGISISNTPFAGFTPYNVATGVEKIISMGGTSTSVNYFDTTSSVATHSVTIRTYYTDDTIISTQSSDASFHNISIVHNAGNTTTNGTIIMPIAPLYTGTAVLDSNNTNAVIAQNRTHFTIYTGALTASDWFGYNVSVPNNADHGMWLDTIMRWSNTISGWIFGETAPTDYTNDISDQITVTVS